MGNGGSSSAPRLVEYDGIQNDGTSTTRLSLVDPEHELDELSQLEDDEEYLRAVSRLPLRWGVTPVPRDLARELSTEHDEPVMHLSFGTEDHDVGEPHLGDLYA